MQGMEMTILAKLDLGDWQELFSDRIYERGLAYYEDEAVHDIERIKNKITAAVDGSDMYTVTLYVKDDAVYNMTCTCPYAAKGENCKHMAAVLLALEDGQLLQEEPETNGRKRTWKDILQSMPEQEVRSLLFQLRNLAWVDDVLDQYAQEHKRTSPVYESTEYGIYLVRRIQLMQVLSYPLEEIEKYTASHYNKEVRDMLIHEFFAKGEYEKKNWNWQGFSRAL